MEFTVRALAVGAFLSALGAVGLLTYPSLADDAGLNIWRIVDDRRQITAARERDAALAREVESTARRTALRREALRDVIDGRLPFEEGARRFAELNRLLPGSVADYPRRRFRGRTDEEVAALQLICQLWVTREPAALALAREWECVLAGRGLVIDRFGACE